MNQTLKLESFKNYLEIYGADFDRWPEDIAPSAKRFSESSPEARILVVQMQKLESHLTQHHNVHPPADLLKKITDQAD
ncbi:MAG: hypothetical protein WC043_07730 [Pseudobdellovibrionaceae bacterium]